MTRRQLKDLPESFSTKHNLTDRNFIRKPRYVKMYIFMINRRTENKSEDEDGEWGRGEVIKRGDGKKKMSLVPFVAQCLTT